MAVLIQWQCAWHLGHSLFIIILQKLQLVHPDLNYPNIFDHYVDLDQFTYESQGIQIIEDAQYYL